MPQLSSRQVVVAALVALFLFLLLRDYWWVLLLLLVPLLFLWGLVSALRWLFHTIQTSSVGAATSAHASAPQTTRYQNLRVAFRRSQDAVLERELSVLPPWPIRTQIQDAALSLLALKRSIYRAQAEGVPEPILKRYLGNTEQAADALWRLASKLDALGLQQVPYQVFEERLQVEANTVQQIQRTAHAAQEGVAMLIVSGIQSEGLLLASEDLSALTAAVQRFAYERELRDAT